MKSGAALRLDSFSPDDPEGMTPEFFLGEIHAALEAGSLGGARESAEKGLAHFPHHAELQRLHWALRPGEVRRAPGPPLPSPRMSYDWLRKNAFQHRGQWVALGGGELIAASENFDEVYEASRESRKHTDFIHFID